SAAQPRIEAPFFGNAGGREAAVIVCRIQQAVAWQGENLAVYRTKQRARVTLLKIGAASAADQKAIASECHAAAVQHISHAGFGMARRAAGLQRMLPKADGLTVTEVKVGAGGAAPCGNGYSAATALPVQACAGDMIRM